MSIFSVLICSTVYGGCGFVGKSNEFGGDGDFVICPICEEDHAFQIIEDNIQRLTNEDNYVIARELLEEYNKSKSNLVRR